MLDSSESVLPTNRRQARRIATAHNPPILIDIEKKWIPAIAELTDECNESSETTCYLIFC